MLIKYIFFNEIEIQFTVRGKHHQARLTEGISNAKLITITFNSTSDKNRWTVSFKFHLGKLCRHKQVKGLAGRRIINL